MSKVDRPTSTLISTLANGRDLPFNETLRSMFIFEEVAIITLKSN